MGLELGRRANVDLQQEPRNGLRIAGTKLRPQLNPAVDENKKHHQKFEVHPHNKRHKKPLGLGVAACTNVAKGFKKRCATNVPLN
jgi:hypothetical protein